MMGVKAVDHARHCSISRHSIARWLAVCADLQFVAQRPSRHGRVTLRPLHYDPQPFALLVHGDRICIVEAPAHCLPKRQIGKHGQA